MITSTTDTKRILAAARGKGMLTDQEAITIQERLSLADATARREHYRTRCKKCDATPCACGARLYN